MGKKRRGRDRLVTCISCGRSVPKNKAIEYERRSRISTDLRDENNVSMMTSNIETYCISCGKHRRITEKLKKQAARRKQRREEGF
jgi:ribosomal protein S26